MLHQLPTLHPVRWGKNTEGTTKSLSKTNYQVCSDVTNKWVVVVHV